MIGILIAFVLIERLKQANDGPKGEDSHATNNCHSGSACNSIKNHITKKIARKESEEANPLLTKELEHTVSKLRCQSFLFQKNILLNLFLLL